MAAVNRAHSAVGHGCVYRLGHGGMKPYRTVPWDDEMFCDCSGFACWCLGLSRFQDPVWLDTSRIWSLAGAGNDIFTAADWKSAQAGDLLVYPDRTDTSGERQHGHVGLVVNSHQRGPLLVIHCSSGNWTRHSDAIQETAPDAWIARPDTRVARYVGFAT